MNHMAVIGARAGHSSAHFAEARGFAHPSAAQQSLYSVYFHEYADKSPLLIRLQVREGIAGAQSFSLSPFVSFMDCIRIFARAIQFCPCTPPRDGLRSIHAAADSFLLERRVGFRCDCDILACVENALAVLFALNRGNSE